MPLLFWANGRGDAMAAPFVPATANTYYCPLNTHCIEIFLYLDRDCLFLSLSLLLLSGLIWNTEVEYSRTESLLCGHSLRRLPLVYDVVRSSINNHYIYRYFGQSLHFTAKFFEQ